MTGHGRSFGMHRDMPAAQGLLNEDGSASIATAILMSHHGFRRDVAQLANALDHVVERDTHGIAQLQKQWAFYEKALHGHHHAEDTGIFPHVLSEHPELEPVIARLTAEHRQIDPLLQRLDGAFPGLPKTAADALEAVQQLSSLLDKHLAYEEEHIVPLMRSQAEFPPPANDEEQQLIAEGFAWSCYGVAPEVVEQVLAMLPEALRAKIPAERLSFGARYEAVFGRTKAGASHTCVPDWIGAA